MSKSGKQKKAEKHNTQEQKISLSDIDNSGNYLRTLRIGKGLSIKDVTEATRISETNINAIEDQDFSSLPADTFTRGLLNIYANFLGADSEAIIAKFMEERHKSPSQKKRAKPRQPNKLLSPKRLAEPAHISSMTMAGVLLLLIIVSFAGYCIYTSWNPFSFLLDKADGIQSVMKTVLPHEETPVETDSDEVAVIQANSEPENQLVPAAELTEEKSLPVTPVGDDAIVIEQTPELEKTVPDADGYEVQLRFQAATQIQVAMDEDETVSLEFDAGETHTLNAASTLQIHFSQPDSAEIIINGANVEFPQLHDGNYTLNIPQDIAVIQPDE